MHVRTRAQRVLARYRSVPRADPRGARHRHRRRSRDATRDAARFSETRGGGIVRRFRVRARVDPDALAAKIARWEHDRAEREFRLERARDAKAAEETNGGFRPALSSTPRAVALRDRVASADRRPWHARLRDESEANGARGRKEHIARGREDSIATSNDSNGGGNAIGWLARCTRRLRRATRVGTPIVATAREMRDAPGKPRRRTRRDWRARRVAATIRHRASRGSRRFVSREGRVGTRASRRGGVRRRAAVDARRDSETRRSRYRLCACLGRGRRVTFAPFPRGSSRDSRVPSRAPRRIACARSRRDGTRRRSRSNGPGAGPISVASSASAKDGRASRRRRGGPRGYSAEREASLAETFASVAGTAAANAKLSRTPIGRDRNRRRTPDGDDACGDDVCGDDVCGDARVLRLRAGKSSLNLAARRLGFERAELASNSPASNAPASNALNVPSPNSPSSLPGSVYRPPPSPMRRAPRLAVADRLARKRALTERAIAERRVAKEAEEAKECTFRPENHARVPFEIGERDVDARAYASASEKYPTREQREAAELAECTFKPKINKTPRVRPRADTEPEPPRASEPKTSEPKASDASERRAPNSKAADASRRSAGKVSNAATGRWSGPPPWEPRNAKGGQPPPPADARASAFRRAAGVRRDGSSHARGEGRRERRAGRRPCSTVARRGSIPAAPPTGRRKKAEAKAAKTRAKLADAAKRNIAEKRRASSSARASTPRDRTESVSGAPRSPTIEKETEPNGDETADDDGSARRRNRRASTPPPETSETRRRLSRRVRSSRCRLTRRLPRSSPGRTDRRYLRASSQRPPPPISSYRSGRAPISARDCARSPSRDVDSPEGFPPRRRVRIAERRRRERRGPRRGRPYFRCRGRPYSRRRRRWTWRKNAPSAHAPSRDRRDVDAPRTFVSSVSGRTSVHQI